jgi:uncharacterized LabA/DUF88 family protein
MIDGAFFIKRARDLWGNMTPQELADFLFDQYCLEHLRHSAKSARITTVDLYRIFFYDCPPAEIIIRHPISNQTIDFRNGPQGKWRLELHDAIIRKRKAALRLGKIDEANPTWQMSGKIVKQLCAKEKSSGDITERDVSLNIRQKGVDMRIGLDIAAVAFKKQADQIILIAGDSDFIPAAKLARREGLDFVLDPMRVGIKKELHIHIDGLFTPKNEPHRDSAPPNHPAVSTTNSSTRV